MKTLLIGDPHGKVDKYCDIISQYNIPSISLGDNGFYAEWTELSKRLDPTQHRLLLGNHDDTSFKYYPLSLGDFGMYHNIFFVRGARSIDRHARIEGRDWFPDEELSYKEMSDCLDMYEREKPDFVIAHECPQSICEQLFGITTHSQTRLLLDEMLAIYQPKHFIFGHHHKNKILYKNTKFQCLAELETCIVET